jgi:cell division protein FtsI (penicillin-binding protein 3)
MPEIPISRVLDDINSGRKYIYIKKLASDYERAEVKKAKLAGLDSEETQWRRYPKRRLLSHVIGFVGTDGRGLEGIEKFRDKYLSENKSPLSISIDARIQGIFYRELSSAMQKYGANAAMGMLMNSQTGEMIAMVSLPDFDPENIAHDSMKSRKFMPIRGVFEMGSIFKIFNTAMAIEHGIGLEREYPVHKPFVVRGWPIRDVASFKPPRPSISVAEIMLHSSNPGSAQIALDLPEGAQKEFFERLQFDQALDLEFGRSEKPLMPRQWGPTERATVSFGHGIAVTPMHVLLAVNAMVNGGIYIWPTLQKRSIGAVEGARVITPEQSAALRKIMFNIAELTTARKARVNGINIGGKTATSESATGRARLTQSAT